MDLRRFDDLATALAVADSRRRVISLLAVLPMVGGLLGILPLDDVAGKGRRKRRVKAHKHGDRGRRRQKRDGKRKGKGQDAEPTCTAQPKSATCDGQCGDVRDNCGMAVKCDPCTCEPACGGCETCSDRLVCEPCAACCGDACCPRDDAVCHAGSGACCVRNDRAQTCDGRCGDVMDNCGFTVNCGACTCTPACGECLVCDDETGACVADPTQVGGSCGAPGQVCQAGGACACDPGSCAPCERCQGNGRCSLPCDGAGCCDATGVCRAGDTVGLCGTDGDSCSACAEEEICRADGLGAACRLNQAPEAFNQTFNDDWGKTCVVVTLRGADPDGDPLAFQIRSRPINGRLFLYDEDAADFLGAEVTVGDPTVPAEAGTDDLRLCYRADSRFFIGSDSFRYVAIDTHGAESPISTTPPLKSYIQINILDT